VNIFQPTGGYQSQRSTGGDISACRCIVGDPVTMQVNNRVKERQVVTLSACMDMKGLKVESQYISAYRWISGQN
jgi:hypothetical protein